MQMQVLCLVIQRVSLSTSTRSWKLEACKEKPVHRRALLVAKDLLNVDLRPSQACHSPQHWVNQRNMHSSLGDSNVSLRSQMLLALSYTLMRVTGMTSRAGVGDTAGQMSSRVSWMTLTWTIRFKVMVVSKCRRSDSVRRTRTSRLAICHRMYRLSRLTEESNRG